MKNISTRTRIAFLVGAIDAHPIIDRVMPRPRIQKFLGYPLHAAILLATLCVSTHAFAQAGVIAGWDFQTTNNANGGTAALASPNTPQLFRSNAGVGSLYLDGTYGSSAWASSTQLNAFTGTGINATGTGEGGNGLDPATSATSSLALVGSAANDKSIVFLISMSGRKGLQLTYAARTSGTTAGFTTHTWSYSVDGENWTDYGIITPFTTSFAAKSLPPTSALDGAPSVYLRCTFSGATTTTSNNRLDNILFTAVGPLPPDSDGDGVADLIDNCPTIANPMQADCNGNGIGDACELAAGAPDCNTNTIPDSCELAAGTALDCNANGVPDSCDIASGLSHDVDSNGIPDECKADCNGNGLPDAWEISQGTATDCNLNAIPDACENDSGTISTGNMGAFGAGVTAVGALTGCVPSTTPVSLRLDLIGDLNATTEYATLKLGGVTVGSLLFQTTGRDCPTTPDSVLISITAAQWNSLLASAATSGVIAVEVLGSPLVSATQCAKSLSVLTAQYGGPRYDCDSNGVSDLCQIAAGAADCNHNARLDACEIQAGTVTDVDQNGTIDSCQVDCNTNQLPDSWEISQGTAPDCNANGVPDSCDVAAHTVPDCNTNGVPDSCDIASGASNDVDSNGIPDECKTDCNGNGLPDAWEISQGTVPDCNLNSIPDSCDLTSGAAADCNNNGVPDSCDIASGATDKDANGQPDDCQYAYGDFDLSGDIGGADLGFLLAVWGTNSVVGDLDGDHIIGGGDLGLLLSRWGPVQ
jgi:hypothetical protein